MQHKRFSPVAFVVALACVGLVWASVARGATLARRDVNRARLDPVGPLATATPTRTPTPVNVGNFVWDDLDHDGRQDAGEPGLAGIRVQLWNAALTQLIGATYTNSNGNYSLQAPFPGNYRVRVLLNSGDQFSPIDAAGGDDQLDSDINPSGAYAGFTNIYTFPSNLISITTIDAGLVNVTIIPTPMPSATPTATATQTPTQTPTNTPVGTLPPGVTPRAYLSLTRR